MHDANCQIHWLTQAAWLVLMLRQLGPGSAEVLTSLFHAVPTAHPLEFLLAALTLLVFTRNDAEESRNAALKLLSIAAGNQSMPPDEAADWLRQRAADTGTLLRETLRSLEALAPDPWVFDRQSVIASLAAGVRSLQQKGSSTN